MILIWGMSVKRRIGNDEVGLQVFVRVVEKGTFIIPLYVGAVYPANGKVHFGLNMRDQKLPKLLTIYKNSTMRLGNGTERVHVR